MRPPTVFCQVMNMEDEIRAKKNPSGSDEVNSLIAGDHISGPRATVA